MTTCMYTTVCDVQTYIDKVAYVFVKTHQHALNKGNTLDNTSAHAQQREGAGSRGSRVCRVKIFAKSCPTRSMTCVLRFVAACCRDSKRSSVLGGLPVDCLEHRYSCVRVCYSVLQRTVVSVNTHSNAHT